MSRNHMKGKRRERRARLLESLTVEQKKLLEEYRIDNDVVPGEPHGFIFDDAFYLESLRLLLGECDCGGGCSIEFLAARVKAESKENVIWRMDDDGVIVVQSNLAFQDNRCDIFREMQREGGE
jgi:hypothetical protein